MIDYHDEAQWEVQKSLVKWKKIKDEGEADYLQTQGWSSVTTVKGQKYVAYCEVGKLGIDSIAEAGRILKIKVPLTGEYLVGRSWSETH